MSLPVPPSTSKNERTDQAENETSFENKETMLQVVLVALLAGFGWGLPFSGSAGTGQLRHDRGHVAKHLEGTVDEQNVRNISDDEMRYHYFQSHDFDGNRALDGLEILKAILHVLPDKTGDAKSGDVVSSADSAETNSSADSENGGGQPETTEFYIEVIDRVLNEDDKDKDGFLSYPEFVIASERAAASQQESEQGSPASTTKP